MFFVVGVGRIREMSDAQRGLMRARGRQGSEHCAFLFSLV